jgi:hypothetical protein
MSAKPKAKPTRKPSARDARLRAAVTRHRAKMRKSGMRLLQLWVPDTAAPGFAEECRRQSLAVSRSAALPDREFATEVEAWTADLEAQLGEP